MIGDPAPDVRMANRRPTVVRQGEARQEILRGSEACGWMMHAADRGVSAKKAITLAVMAYPRKRSELISVSIRCSAIKTESMCGDKSHVVAFDPAMSSGTNLCETVYYYFRRQHQE
jgi:hypothetical protein